MASDLTKAWQATAPGGSSSRVTCPVCGGTGQARVDNPDGSFAGQRPCPVCGGKGTTDYVRKNRNAWLNYWAWWRRFFLACMVGLFIFDRTDRTRINYVSPLSEWLLVLWIVLIVCWFLTWCNHKPRATKPSTGFTDNREVATLAAFGAVVAGKVAYDNHERKQHQAIQQAVSDGVAQGLRNQGR